MIGRFDDRVLALIDRVWAGFGERIERAGRLGFVWGSVSTPIVAVEGDRVLAHVGVLALPVVVAGVRRVVGGIHAVATDPDHRGRGHASALLAEALEHCRPRYETLLLTTDIPGFYARVGFRPVREHVFWGRVSPRPAPPAGAVRQLSLDEPADVALLRRLLATRAPVSARLGPVEPGAIFGIACLLQTGRPETLQYVAPLDAVVVCERRGATLTLLDVVAASIPRLPALLEWLGAGVREVQTLFTPDRLGGPLIPQPRPATELMVRGPFAPEGLPMMLPPYSRF